MFLSFLWERKDRRWQWQVNSRGIQRTLFLFLKHQVTKMFSTHSPGFSPELQMQTFSCFQSIPIGLFLHLRMTQLCPGLQVTSQNPWGPPCLAARYSLSTGLGAGAHVEPQPAHHGRVLCAPTLTTEAEQMAFWGERKGVMRQNYDVPGASS